MLKLVKTMLRSLGRAEKPRRQVRPANYVPLYAPGEGEIFADFSRVPRVAPSFALRIEVDRLTVCVFAEKVFLFTPERVMVCNFEGGQEAYFEAPELIQTVHAIDQQRLLCLGAENGYVLSWEDETWAQCGSDFRALRGLAWLGSELLGFFPSVPGEEAVFRVRTEGWTLETLLDPSFDGRLQAFGRVQKDGTLLSSARLDPTTSLVWKAAHPLGPAQGAPSNPQEKVWRVLFDPEASTAPQVGRPKVHWRAYPSHQQEQVCSSLASAGQGTVVALLEQAQARVVVCWVNPELVPATCRVCEAGVRVDRTSCLCGAQAPGTGIRALNRPLVFSPRFEEHWQRYLELRQSREQERPPTPAGYLDFGHLNTLLRPVRERYFQAGLMRPEGWEGGEVLEDVSCRAEIRDGLCLHVHGRDFLMLTTLEDGSVTILVRGRFKEPAVAAEVSVERRRLFLGSSGGVSEFELGAEVPTARRYDECITYYDGADGSKRALNGVKRMALSQCRNFLFVFSGSAHVYRMVDEGLQYLGQEDLLSFYGRRDSEGRVMAHRHGQVFLWSAEEEAWQPVPGISR